MGDGPVMVRNGIHKSVLVVEDDLSVSNLIERVLRGISPVLQLDWSTSAEDAMGYFNSSSDDTDNCPYQLVICDFYLEGPKTGLDFWYFFRSRYRDVPFVLMSSVNLEDFFDPDESIDIPYFLKKPFDIGQCRTFFSGILNGGESDEEAPL
jgi:response regulator of citrate/malate metabolism